MALKEYNVKAGRRGNVETTVLLSDEDAAAQGFTSKDLVSKTDHTVEASNPEFKPATEADLAPGAAAAAAAQLEAALAEEQRVKDEQAAKVAAARAEAERATEAAAAQEAAAKEAAAPKNKARAAAPNKGAAAGETK